MKIFLIFISLVLFISGCGDSKSAGERMGEAVSVIRGDKKPTPLLIPKHSTKDTNTSLNKPQQVKKPEPKKKTIIKKEQNQGTQKDSKNLSLKDIALKAKEEIRKAALPAKELKDDVKSALEIAKDSIKEVISENKESIKGTIIDMKGATKDKIKEAKEKFKEEAKKIQELIEVDKTKPNKE